MRDPEIEFVFHFYTCVFQIFLFFLNKRQRYMPIYDRKSFLDNNILLKGHRHELERFAIIYKNNNKPIVLRRSNEASMTLRNTRKYKQKCINIANPFDDIIEINTVDKTVHVGAMITMGKLMNYLYPLGYALPVVPEFKSLTVGGLIVGGGLESSSAQYGLFPFQCIEYTVVLGNGEIRSVTEDKESELFSAIPFSYGTLGTIVDVRMNIIPIKQNIRLECICIPDYNNIQSQLQSILKDRSTYNFIEGIIYSKTKTIVIKGTFIDKLVYPVIDPVTWYDPYFYQSIETFVDQGKTVCTMNLLDYYFRHDRGSFWLLKHIIGDNKLCRAINPFVNHASDKHMIMQPVMKKILKFRNIEIQDSVVPLSNLDSILDFANKHYSIYPIWLCPCRNIDATLNQKRIMCKLSKQLNKDIISADNFINLERLIEMMREKDIDMLKNYINLYKDYFYKDKIDELLVSLNSEMNYEEGLELILQGLQIKTSFLGLLHMISLDEYYVDIGIYGSVAKNTNSDKILRLLEDLTNSKQGLMGQYAVTTLTRPEFEKRVLKKEWYLYLRNKYHATDSFPDIYDKLKH